MVQSVCNDQTLQWCSLRIRWVFRLTSARRPLVLYFLFFIRAIFRSKRSKNQTSISKK